MADPSNAPASITAFFPCHNDGESLRQMVPLAVEALAKISSDFEIIMIDDGSTGNTPAILDSLETQYACVRVIWHTHKRGYGAALQTGFRNAGKHWVFYTDGDGQYDVRELSKLWSLAAADVDGVVGFKTRRADSKIRRIIGQLYNSLVRRLFNLKVRDVDCDFRLLRRKLLDSVSLTASSGAICVDLMRQIESGGFRVLEIPVNHYPRAYGKSHFFRVLPVTQTFFDILSLWFRWMVLKRLPVAAGPLPAADKRRG